jgi:hypothetical protein
MTTLTRKAALDELVEERLAETRAEVEARAESERRQAEAAEVARQHVEKRAAAQKQWIADCRKIADAVNALAATIRVARASGAEAGVNVEGRDRELSLIVIQGLRPVARMGVNFGVLRLPLLGKPQLGVPNENSAA